MAAVFTVTVASLRSTPNCRPPKGGCFGVCVSITEGGERSYRVVCGRYFTQSQYWPPNSRGCNLKLNHKNIINKSYFKNVNTICDEILPSCCIKMRKTDFGRNNIDFFNCLRLSLAPDCLPAGCKNFPPRGQVTALLASFTPPILTHTVWFYIPWANRAFFDP